MRACIVYFSQTGNTRKVAESMQESLAAAAGFCAIYRLEEADPAALSRYDLIGLGTPALYLREPLNVRWFLESFPRQSGGAPRPFFLFVTHGGTPGDVFSRIGRLARGRGLAAVGCFRCLGVDTFPPYADRSPLIAAGHPDAADLERARRFAASMVEAAAAFRSGDPGVRMPGSFLSRLASGLFNGRALRLLERHGVLPHKRVDPGRCTRCGLCVQACPQGIIRLAGLPSIADRGCIYCYHCHRTCPQQAILCDWTPLRILSGHYFRKWLAASSRRREP